VNIAIVGAGLTAAHVLARRHRVTVIEATTCAGGHTRMVDVHDGERLGVHIASREGRRRILRACEVITAETRSPQRCVPEGPRSRTVSEPTETLAGGRLTVADPWGVWGVLDRPGRRGAPPLGRLGAP
jgi:hypothetical protein